MRKFFWIPIILVSFLALGLIANRYYYDVKEWWVLKDTIIWSKNTELVWSAFIYDKSKNLTDNIDANVGISARYRITDKIHYRSRTAFVPSKSYISDTTDPLALRIANVRFDLCEVYRRKLENHIDSLRSLDPKKVELEYLAKQDIIFVEKFSEEWTEFLNVPKDEVVVELEKLEDKVNKELKFGNNLKKTELKLK